MGGQKLAIAFKRVVIHNFENTTNSGATRRIMKIKLLGIDFSLGQGIDLAEMFSYIESKGEAGAEFGGYGRFVYIAKRDDYYVGLLITTKDHKKYLEFKKDKASAKLETKEVSQGAKFADFNFFAINKKGKGIFQYYHHSCSLNMFGIICRSFYEKLKAEKITAAYKNCANEKEEKAVRKQYAGTLKWDVVVRPEAFDKLISDLKSINAVTLNISTLAYENTLFTPLSRVARRMTQRYTFGSNAPLTSLVAGIKQVVSGANVDGAKVEGIDQENLEQVIKLVNTPDFFGEFDFDSVAENMTITPSDFVHSNFLTEILKAAKKVPALRN
jgi:hypothetical protein